MRQEALNNWIEAINARCLWTAMAGRNEIACYTTPHGATFITTSSITSDQCQIYISIAQQHAIHTEINTAEKLLGLPTT